MSRFRAVPPAALLVVALVFACGASDKGSGRLYVPADASVDADGSDGPSEGPWSGCAPACTSDRHSAIMACDDGRSFVTETCALDRTCARGACVTLCEAAKGEETSLGCEFVAVSPSVVDLEFLARGACYAAFLANASPIAVDVSVEHGGDALDVTNSMFLFEGGVFTPLIGQIPAGKAAVVFLSQGTGLPCPGGTTAAVQRDDSIIHTSGRTSSFRLKTTAPVSAYAMYPFSLVSGVVPTATLLLPVESLGTKYVVVDPWPRTPETSSNPFTQIVATDDGTVVTLTPSANIESAGGLPSGSRGAPYTFTMQRGEVVQFLQSAELTGTPLSSNKPVAVLGGHQCMFVPAGQSYCDAAQQQLPALSSWGTEYAVASYRPRTAGATESVPYRIVAAVSGTTLTYSPAIPSAPRTLAAGEIASFETDAPFVVRSQDAQHPIFVASYMTGGTLAGDVGDPDFVNVVPTAQYLSSYTFYADPSFPETSLTLIRKRGPAGFADVELDCAGNVRGWSPLGTDFEVAHVDLSRGASPVVHPTGTCAPGRRVARSAQPFALTVWGWGYTASYGYPAGAGTRRIYAP